jgi:hypothetical protein
LLLLSVLGIVGCNTTIKSMKRLFRRKKRSQSANVGSGYRKPKEEQATDTAHSAPPSVGSNKESIGASASARLNMSGSQGDVFQKNGDDTLQAGSDAPREKTGSMEASTSDSSATRGVASTSKKSGNSKLDVLKPAIEPAATRNFEEDRKEPAMQYADTDSDDAGLLPSEGADYKGVSPTFRGVGALDQFDEEKGFLDPDGRLAGISDAYDSIPLIEQTKLPRGGVSMETKAIGRIQVRLNCLLSRFQKNMYRSLTTDRYL